MKWTSLDSGSMAWDFVMACRYFFCVEDSKGMQARVGTWAAHSREADDERLDGRRKTLEVQEPVIGNAGRRRCKQTAGRHDALFSGPSASPSRGLILGGWVATGR